MQPIVNVRSPICISLTSISIGKHDPSLRQPTVSIGSAGVSVRAGQAPPGPGGRREVVVMAGRDDQLQRLPDHLVVAVSEQSAAPSG